MDAWAERPFARTFDLISSQYGWTDSTILDLTIGRFRQIRDILFQRQAEEQRRHLRTEETVLRIQAQYMARSAAAQREARKITLLEAPKRVVPIPASKVGSLFGASE